MARKIILYLAVFLLIAGAGVLLYPTIEQWFYARGVASQKEQFLQNVRIEDGTSSAAGVTPLTPEELARKQKLDALYAWMQSENKRLFETGQSDLVDAFSYQQPAIDLSQYGLADDIVGYLSIPSIQMELPLYLGANTENMAKGAVHLTETSYPIGGDNTNCVIAAHRGTSLVMFRNIDRIQLGDLITIVNFRETLTYKVVQTKIILPTDINQILIQPGRDMVTLISCNPLGANYQRYVVYCERWETGAPAGAG